MKVVLVHGIFGTGHILSWMKYKLEQNGFECFSPSLWPVDGTKGIEHVALDLKRKIDQRFGDTTNVAIIGFSMGGIVARYYLQELGGVDRVNKFFTVAAPHNGTYWAYLPYPTKGVKQLRPNSEFLKRLKKNDDKLLGVKLYSYWTPLDTSIVPSSSSYWEVAENKKFLSFLHLFIVFNRNVIKELILKLKCDNTLPTE